jgi:hypothetical protein
MRINAAARTAGRTGFGASAAPLLLALGAVLSAWCGRTAAADGIRIRATVRDSAVYLIIETFAGQTLGPLFLALVSQDLLGDPASLPLALGSMVLVYAAMATLAAFLLEPALARHEKASLQVARSRA